MGLSDGAFSMIKHTPLPNGNHSILSPVCPMGVADTLQLGVLMYLDGVRLVCYIFMKIRET